MALFIYLWLRWVFVAVPRLSLVALNGGYPIVAMLRLPVAVVLGFLELR